MENIGFEKQRAHTHTHTALSVLDKKQGSPTITEDSVFDSSKQAPPKPTRSVKWSPESTPVINSSPAMHHKMIIRGLSDSSTPDHHTIPIQTTSLQNNLSSSPADAPEYTSAANTIPSGNSLYKSDSEDPIPHSLIRDTNVALIRTGSGSSTKSLELPTDGSLTRRPPPKPSKLTGGKVAANKTTSLTGLSKDEAPSSKPSQGPVSQESDSPSAHRPPPKPARTSIKQPRVTEPQSKEIELATNNSVTTPTDSLVGDEKPAQRPPAKPSRNYKSVKILSPTPRPEESTTPPYLKSKTLGDKPSSSENIKPSELLRRSRSPAQSEVANGNRRGSNTSSGSNLSQSDSDRPTPKPRSISGSLSGKPAPPAKPPRKSVKLKNPSTS